MNHPLEKFKFCPACGSASFVINDERSKQCEYCGFTYYCNASASTVAVIIDDEKRLLVVRRSKEPARGTLDLPGGFVDPGETLEEGCIREVKEELGVDAFVRSFLFSLPNQYNFSNFIVHTTDAFFEVEISSVEELQAGDDAEAYFWLPLDKIKPEEFGLDSIRKGIERILTKY